VPSPATVLFLVPALPVGGAERQMALLVRALDRSRYRPIVACQHAVGPVADEMPGVPVHLLSDSTRLDPRFFARLASLMRRERVRIVISHGFSTGVAARLAGLVAGVPVRILAEHSTREPEMTPWRHRVNRVLSPWTSAWVALTPGQVAYLRDTKKIPASRLHVIPNGIDPEAFGSGRGRERVRAECGVPPEARVAGILAVLRPEKDHRTFLLAARFVVDEFPDARFLIVGDGPCRGDLERETTVLALERNVHFLGRRDDVADVLAAFDVAVLCSEIETLPLAFLEAMASRLPLVGTRVGGLPDVVVPEHNGLLVNPRDPRDLADAVLRVLRDPDLARSWGDAARRDLERTYTVTAMVRGYEELFTRLLAARGVSVPSAPSDSRGSESVARTR
jgi:glycosyltransferase involved in cell wall biosynthesis